MNDYMYSTTMIPAMIFYPSPQSYLQHTDHQYCIDEVGKRDQYIADLQNEINRLQDQIQNQQIQHEQKFNDFTVLHAERESICREHFETQIHTLEVKQLAFRRRMAFITASKEFQSTNNQKQLQEQLDVLTTQASAEKEQYTMDLHKVQMEWQTKYEQLQKQIERLSEAEALSITQQQKQQLLYQEELELAIQNERKKKQLVMTEAKSFQTKYEQLSKDFKRSTEQVHQLQEQFQHKHNSLQKQMEAQKQQYEKQQQVNEQTIKSITTQHEEAINAQKLSHEKLFCERQQVYQKLIESDQRCQFLRCQLNVFGFLRYLLYQNPDGTPAITVVDPEHVELSEFVKYQLAALVQQHFDMVEDNYRSSIVINEMTQKLNERDHRIYTLMTACGKNQEVVTAMLRQQKKDPRLTNNQLYDQLEALHSDCILFQWIVNKQKSLLKFIVQHLQTVCKADTPSATLKLIPAMYKQVENECTDRESRIWYQSPSRQEMYNKPYLFVWPTPSEEQK